MPRGGPCLSPFETKPARRPARAGCRQPRATSGDEFANHLSRDIREPEITALEAVRKPQMVEAEQMQDGGVQIIDVDRIAHHVPADLISFSPCQAALDAAA